MTRATKDTRRSRESDSVEAELGSRLDHLEELVEELIKETPHEQIVKVHMRAAGLVYSSDPVERMNQVLSAIESARSIKGRDHGKEI